LTIPHATDMSLESQLPLDDFEAKYGSFRKSVLTAYHTRRPLRALDAVVSWVEDVAGGGALEAPVDRPIFVLGNFRSGTTFLEQVLARHPSLGHFTWLTSAFPRSPRFAALMRRTIPGFAFSSVLPHQPNMVADAESPFEAESIWRFCRNNVWSRAATNVLDADFSDPPFERLLRRTIHKQLRLQGKARFLHKNPPNTARLGFLARVFPDARFVYIVRHPLRMLRSQLDMENLFRRVFPPTAGRDYGEAFFNLYLPPARLFVRTSRHAEIAAALTRDPPLAVAMSLTDVHRECERMIERRGLQGRVLTLRYEDLVADFEPEMAKVLSFVGLEDDVARKLARAQARSVDSGLTSRRSPLPRFSPAVLSALQPLLERFGYRAE
jgi:hypothetical protein